MATPGASTAASSQAAGDTDDDDEEYFEEDEDVVEPGDDSGVKCCDNCKCESYTRRQLRELAPTEGHHMLMVYMGNLQQTCRKRQNNYQENNFLSERVLKGVRDTVNGHKAVTYQLQRDLRDQGKQMVEVETAAKVSVLNVKNLLQATNKPFPESRNGQGNTRPA